MTVQHRHARSMVTVQYRHARSTVTVQYRHAKSTVTVQYHHTRSTMTVLQKNELVTFTCDQTHALSSLENILHFIIQYTCQRMTSKKLKALFYYRSYSNSIICHPLDIILQQTKPCYSEEGGRIFLARAVNLDNFGYRRWPIFEFGPLKSDSSQK